MNFELPLTEKQRKRIIKGCSSQGISGRTIANYIINFEIGLLLLTGEMFCGLALWGIIEYIIRLNVRIEYYLFLLILFIVVKRALYKLNSILTSTRNIQEAFFTIEGMKCIMVNSANINSNKHKKKRGYVGKKRIDGYLLTRSFSFELDGRVISSNDDKRCIVIGNTAKRILEGNREHLGVIYGKYCVILIAASLIDKRYAKLTFDELKELAGMSKYSTIEEEKVESYTKNNKLKKLFSEGRKLDNAEKKNYAYRIFMQFYNDNEERSTFKEIIDRGKGWLQALIGDYALISAIIFYCYRGFGKIYVSYLNIHLLYVSVALIYVAITIFEIYYYFVRNDVSRGILKSEECMELHGRLHFAESEVNSGNVTDNYVLELDSGKILSEIHLRDDIYIYPGMVDERVLVLAADNMIAIYPEGYFI